MKDTDRRDELRRLWLATRADRRTSNDVLIFFGWLAGHRSDLVGELAKASKGKPYELLEADLAGLREED